MPFIVYSYIGICKYNCKYTNLFSIFCIFAYDKTKNNEKRSIQ